MRLAAIRVFATLSAMAAVTHSAAADPIFSVTDLSAIIGTGLNNNGQVVGQASNASGTNGGVLYEGYGPSAGTIFLFGSQYLPNAINDSGLMIGSTVINNNGVFSYGTVDGTVTPIASSGQIQGAVDQINGAGQVVLTEEGPPVDTFHAAINTPNDSQISIPMPAGQTLMTAVAINNAGQVVGWTGTVMGTESTAQAFIYSGGAVHSLGTLPGDTASMATAVNNAGQVVGFSWAGGADHGFLYSNGTMQSLGTLGGTASVPEGINNNGEIYGYSTTANGSEHAFLDINGTMIDLTNLLHSLTGSISQYAYYTVTGINDSGQVLVQASNTNEDTNTYLLTPAGLPVPAMPDSNFVTVPVDIGPYTPPSGTAPEPSAGAICAILVAACLARQRWSCKKGTRNFFRKRAASL